MQAQAGNQKITRLSPAPTCSMFAARITVLTVEVEIAIFPLYMQSTIASTAAPSVLLSPIGISSPLTVDSARPDVSKPCRYGERLASTFLCACILRPSTTSTISINYPASRPRRMDVAQCPSSGGSTVTVLGAAAAAAGAQPLLHRAVGGRYRSRLALAGVLAIWLPAEGQTWAPRARRVRQTSI